MDDPHTRAKDLQKRMEASAAGKPAQGDLERLAMPQHRPGPENAPAGDSANPDGSRLKPISLGDFLELKILRLIGRSDSATTI